VTKRFKLEGHFKIIITSNKYLRVRLDGDMGAWGRRMLIIPFVGETPENPIPHFDEVLLEEEGEGILNLLIQKAAELLQHGFPKEALAHTRAVRFLQYQSDPIGSFLSECVEEADSGPGITKGELEERYAGWCKVNKLPPLVGNKLPQMLSAGMGATFNVSEAHSVGTKRGFHGVAFKADNQ
jgi:phage/plasmid-associated DNA primase